MTPTVILILKRVFLRTRPHETLAQRSRTTVSTFTGGQFHIRSFLCLWLGEKQIGLSNCHQLGKNDVPSNNYIDKNWTSKLFSLTFCVVSCGRMSQICSCDANGSDTNIVYSVMTNKVVTTFRHYLLRKHIWLSTLMLRRGGGGWYFTMEEVSLNHRGEGEDSPGESYRSRTTGILTKNLSMICKIMKYDREVQVSYPKTQDFRNHTWEFNDNISYCVRIKCRDKIADLSRFSRIIIIQNEGFLQGSSRICLYLKQSTIWINRPTWHYQLVFVVL